MSFKPHRFALSATPAVTPSLTIERKSGMLAYLTMLHVFVHGTAPTADATIEVRDSAEESGYKVLKRGAIKSGEDVGQGFGIALVDPIASPTLHIVVTGGGDGVLAIDATGYYE